MEPIEAIGPRRADALGEQLRRLWRLARAGLPVPRAYVLKRSRTDELYGRILGDERGLSGLLDTGAALPSSDLLERYRAGVFELSTEQELRTRILEAYSTLRALGAPSVVVSAFVVVDKPGFDGPLGDVQLGVDHDAQAVEAVARALAGVFDTEVLTPLRLSRAKDLSVVVLMQQLVDGFVSGVTYTAHPITEDPHEWLIRSGYGLASGVRCARVASDLFRVSRDGFVRDRVVRDKPSHLALERDGSRTIQPVPEALVAKPSLNEATLLELLRLAGRVERELDRPVSFDWAYAQGQVYLLRADLLPGHARLPRARTIGRAARARALWSHTELGELLPKPLSPFVWSLVDAFTREGLAHALAAAGAALGAEPELLMDVRGRVFLNLGTLTEAVSRIPGLRKEVLARVGLSLPPDAHVPERPGPIDLTRAVLRIYDAHVRFGASVEALSRRMADEIGHFSALDARLLSPDAVERVLCDVESFLGEVSVSLMRIFGTWIATLLALRSLLARYAGDDAFRLERALLWGPDLPSAAAGHDFRQLVLSLAEQPEAKAWAADPTAPLPESVRSAVLEFAQRHLHEGPAMWDPMSPRWREHPERLWGPLRALLSDPQLLATGLDREARAASQREAAERALTSCLPLGLRPVAKLLLTRAKKLSHDRDRLLLQTARAVGMLREIAVDSSRRFAMRLDEESADSAFFLSIGELHEALARGSWDQGPRIDMRRVEYRQLASCPVPVDRFQARPRAECTDEGPVSGVFGGGGVAQGRVVRLESPERLSHLPAEAVLVVRACDVGLCAVLPAVRAVVAEQGGVLSHGAVLGAALGVPVVVGVKNALGRLNEGETVRVDADSYRIERIG